jgi:hypothetical protein
MTKTKRSKVAGWETLVPLVRLPEFLILSSALPPDPLSVLTLLDSTYRAKLDSRNHEIQTISIANNEEAHRRAFAGNIWQMETA